VEHALEKESMTELNLMLYSLYLPLNYNDRRPIPADKLAWAHTEIVRYAGGSTVLPLSDGWWVDDDNQLFHDRIMLIQVVTSSDTATERFFCHLAGTLARLLEQHEIFIHRMPVVVLQADSEKGAVLQLA
jgi:hypothetical protein